MAINWTGIGSALSGIGSVAGALGLGSKSKGMSPWDQQALSIGGMAAGARRAGEKYGFHPLALLGHSPASGSQSVQVGQVGTALEGVGNAFSRYGQQKVQNQQLANQTNVSNAQVQEAKSRAKLADMQSAKIANDIVAQQAKDSLAARAAQRINQQADAEAIVTPYGTTVPNPRYTDAETAERVYGGAVGEIYGLGRWLGERGEELGKWLYGKHRQRNRDQRFNEWSDYDSRTAP